MNPGMFLDLFKMYFLWGATRGQKNNIKALMKESVIIGLGILLFHVLSIIATTLYVMPYMQNAIEGAFYSMGLSLQEFGLQDKMVQVSFLSGLVLATLLEIVTVAIAAKFIDEWNRYRNLNINSKNVVKVGVTLSLLVMLQVGTAFGGIINTMVLLQTDKADRELIKSKKIEMDNTIYSIKLLQNKINAIESGKYIPTQDELKIANKSSLIPTLKEQLNTINTKLLDAEKMHNEYAKKIRESYNKKGYYTKAEKKIEWHYQQTVAPLLNQKNKILSKLEGLESVKTSLTIEEYLKKLKNKKDEMVAYRDKLYKHLKYLQEKIKKSINITNGLIAFAIGFALFLVIVQSFLENLGQEIKQKISRTLDRLDPSVRARRVIKTDTTPSNIEEQLKELEKEESELEEFINPETEKVLKFMQEFFKQQNRLPSISETEKATNIKKHKLLEIRRELRAKEFYKDENGTPQPTQKFFTQLG